MPTTSNVYQYTDSSSNLLRRAFNLIEIRPSEVTQEHLDDAKIAINLILLDWSTKGVNLWAVDLQIIPLLQGIATYSIDPATIAILDAYVSSQTGPAQNDTILESISRSEYARYPTKGQVSKPSVFWFDNLAPSQIYNSTLLGSAISISGSGSLATLTYSGSEALAVGAPIRISESSVPGYNVVSLVTSSSVQSGVVTVSFPSLLTDTITASGSVYLQSMTGPTITLYPVPSADNYPFLKFYRLRQNQYSEIRNGQIPEMPATWQLAFVDSLAYQLARSWKKPLAADLKLDAMDSYRAASGRNTESADLYISPDFARYTL